MSGGTDKRGDNVECAHAIAATLAEWLNSGHIALVWCKECGHYVKVTQEGIVDDRKQD